MAKFLPKKPGEQERFETVRKVKDFADYAIKKHVVPFAKNVVLPVAADVVGKYAQYVLATHPKVYVGLQIGKKIAPQVLQSLPTIKGKTFQEGEIPVPQITPSGVMADPFSGPGTKTDYKKVYQDMIHGNLQKYKVSIATFAALKHDIRYGLAGLEQDDEKRKHAVRQADYQMVDELKNAEKKDIYDTINAYVQQKGIEGKMLSEDYGLVDENAYTDTTQRMDPEQAMYAEAILNAMEQSGMGRVFTHKQKHKYTYGTKHEHGDKKELLYCADCMGEIIKHA